MNFSLVFQNSGDLIPLQTIDEQSSEVLCYFVDNLNQHNMNKFSSRAGAEIKQSVDNLHATINECNNHMYELLDGYIDTYDFEDYLNQRNLNKLHADWVHSQKINYDILKKKRKYQSPQSQIIQDMFSDDITQTSVGNLLQKLGLDKLYGNINQDLHVLELLFNNLKFTTDHWIEIDNPFPKSILTNNISNFRLTFNHLGRTLYNKFVFFDHDLEFDDENSFNQLLGFVDLRLCPPQTIPLSQEYVDWCHKHNKSPIGDNLNIGNILDLDQNLTKYRKIIFQNTLQNDNFSIELHKGT